MNELKKFFFRARLHEWVRRGDGSGHSRKERKYANIEKAYQVLPSLFLLSDRQ